MSSVNEVLVEEIKSLGLFTLSQSEVFYRMIEDGQTRIVVTYDPDSEDLLNGSLELSDAMHILQNIYYQGIVVDCLNKYIDHIYQLPLYHTYTSKEKCLFLGYCLQNSLLSGRIEFVGFEKLNAKKDSRMLCII